MSKYVCRFVFQVKQLEVEGTMEMRDGFWINAEFERTTGSDCKYWIPPSQILYIEKKEAGLLMDVLEDIG